MNCTKFTFFRHHSLLAFLVLFFIQHNSFSQQYHLIPYRKGNLWGYSNWNKSIIIPCEYDEVGIFYNNIAWVKRDGKYGYIKDEGCLLAEIKFDAVQDFFDKYAMVRIGKNEFTINTSGEKATAEWENFATCEVIDSRGRVTTEFRVGDKVGYAKNDGSGVIIPAIYDKVIENDFYMFYVKLNGKWGIADTNHVLLHPIELDSIFQDYKEYTRYIKNGKVGFLENKTAAIFIEAKYEDADPFYRYLTLVTYKGKKGYISKNKVEYFED